MYVRVKVGSVFGPGLTVGRYFAHNPVYLCLPEFPQAFCRSVH